MKTNALYIHNKTPHYLIQIIPATKAKTFLAVGDLTSGMIHHTLTVGHGITKANFSYLDLLLFFLAF